MAVGVDLLAEGGWPAVTTRAVAERATANVGLIHYHFGGVGNLHRAIAERAGDLVINPVIDELLEASDEQAALDTLRGLLPSSGSTRASRLAVELVVGAMRDSNLGAVMRDQMRQSRAQAADRLATLRPHWSASRCAGVATLVVALLDGLMLHLVLDEDLPTEEALAAIEELVGDRDDTPVPS
ncbi:TetR/AcrR family transcriptional regulator [Actinoalloteichus sp. AHMU CJ021]|uniref:Transcriptional regulator, TetR family n=1 Tax=Actinoalloteichus caeruleus DSM 43889 TaxID=1120930 RepID=A0ABT1JNA3_ACTCY|nr:TetR/AcrR family transcriptional regulator [Actinoalloteichus sp. AHMU CJ021]MCP2333996.1 transcriptional regulator, TetR family [Actinoalloteichus caeruleus DSM 43889]